MLKFRSLNPGGGQGQFLAPDALHLAYPSVGIEFGHGEKFVAGLFDLLFHPYPIKQRALGFFLGGGDLHQVAEIRSNRGNAQVGTLWRVFRPPYRGPEFLLTIPL